MTAQFSNSKGGIFRSFSSDLGHTTRQTTDVPALEGRTGAAHGRKDPHRRPAQEDRQKIGEVTENAFSENFDQF